MNSRREIEGISEMSWFWEFDKQGSSTEKEIFSPKMNLSDLSNLWKIPPRARVILALRWKVRRSQYLQGRRQIRKGLLDPEASSVKHCIHLIICLGWMVLEKIWDLRGVFEFPITGLIVRYWILRVAHLPLSHLA